MLFRIFFIVPAAYAFHHIYMILFGENLLATRLNLPRLGFVIKAQTPLPRFPAVASWGCVLGFCFITGALFVSTRLFFIYYLGISYLATVGALALVLRVYRF